MKRNKTLKKALAALLAFVMLMAPATAVGAQQQAAAEQAAAETLHSLGLLRGVGTTAGGEPIFALSDTVTRLQGLIMLTRFLGLYDEAIGSDYPNPFEDVQGAYDATIVSFAFGRGLTTGVSAVRFAPNDGLTAAQYLTFILRALGYESGTDFEWDTAWTLTDALGITDGEFNAQNNTLDRGNMVIVSLRSIFTPGTESASLFETLVTASVIDNEAIEVLAGALGRLVNLGVLGAGHLDALGEAAEALADGRYITASLANIISGAIEDALTVAPPTPITPGRPTVDVRGNVMFITGWNSNRIVGEPLLQNTFTHVTAWDMRGNQLQGPDGANGVPIAQFSYADDTLAHNDSQLIEMIKGIDGINASAVPELNGFFTFRLTSAGLFELDMYHPYHLDDNFGFNRNVVASLNSLRGNDLIVNISAGATPYAATAVSMARSLPVTPVGDAGSFPGFPVLSVDALVRLLDPHSPDHRSGIRVSVAFDTVAGPLGNAVRGRVFVHSWGTPG